jgi:hypothetical protein
MQGREVDMQALKTRFELTPAVGNVRMNARGDMLDSLGKVVKTAEQLASEGLVGNSQAAAAPQRTVPKADNIPVATVPGDEEFEPGLTEEQAMEILNKAKSKKK